MLNKINNEKQWKDFIRTFSIKPLKKDHKEILKKLRELIVDSIKKNIPDKLAKKVKNNDSSLVITKDGQIQININTKNYNAKEFIKIYLIKNVNNFLTIKSSRK